MGVAPRATRRRTSNSSAGLSLGLLGTRRQGASPQFGFTAHYVRHVFDGSGRRVVRAVWSRCPECLGAGGLGVAGARPAIGRAVRSRLVAVQTHLQKQCRPAGKEWKRAIRQAREQARQGPMARTRPGEAAREERSASHRSRRTTYKAASDSTRSLPQAGLSARACAERQPGTSTTATSS